MYRHLVRHMNYRSCMMGANGKFSDVDAIKIWNIALQLEQKQAPAFLSCF